MRGLPASPRGADVFDRTNDQMNGEEGDEASSAVRESVDDGAAP